MKRVVSLTISIAMLLSIATGLNLTAFAAVNSNFEYSLYDESSVEITAYKGNERNLIIPSEIDGYTVKSIGDCAFEGSTGLNSLTIPSSVEFINWYAFDNCSGLRTLVISEGVKEICRGAFNGCSSLTNVIIPNSVTLIDIGAFADCSALTRVNIPQNVEIIGTYAFQNCSSLSAITVDKNNEYYDSRNNCNAVIETDSDVLILGCKNTNIPNTVSQIGEGAFDGCTQLESITIPDNVTAIGDYAFEGCTGLTSAAISENAERIGTGAFDWCTGLVGITVPISVEFIGSSAFDHCNSLEYIVFLNEDCYIDYDEYTINKSTYIFGYKNSSAQDYAEDYGRTFLPLEEAIPAANMPAVKNVRVSDISLIKATLTFDAVSDADGYEIQYLSNGVWRKIDEITSTSRSFSSLTYNSEYTMRVRAYKVIEGVNIYSVNWSDNVHFRTLNNLTSELKAVTNINYLNISSIGATLTFDKVDGADGYQLQYISNGAWKNFGEITTNSRVFSSLAPDTEYTFRVRAYMVVDGINVYSANWSAAVSFATKPDLPAVENIRFSNITSNGLTIVFDSVAGAAGYEIQYLRSDGWVKMGNVTTNSRTFTSLESGRTYSFRIRAYQIINGNIVYSSNFSEVYSCTTL